MVPYLATRGALATFLFSFCDIILLLPLNFKLAAYDAWDLDMVQTLFLSSSFLSLMFENDAESFVLAVSFPSAIDES